MTEDNNNKQEWITQQLGALSIKEKEEKKIAWLHTLIDIGGENYKSTITTKEVYHGNHEPNIIHSTSVPIVWKDIVQVLQIYFQFIYCSDKYANVAHHVYLDCMDNIIRWCFWDIIVQLCPDKPILFHWGYMTKEGIWKSVKYQYI